MRRQGEIGEGRRAVSIVKNSVRPFPPSTPTQIMLNKPIVMTGMLGAAVGVPYAYHNAPDQWPAWPQAKPAQTEMAPSSSMPPAMLGEPQPVAGPEFPNSLIYDSPTQLVGTGFYSLDQVLRMDISKEWVYQHWARKSTGLADPELFGVRVPLVTGTGMADLAGSLSYYFNAAGQVDRIRFRGTTADTTQLISLMQRQYGLSWQQPRVPGEQLLQARSGDQVVSQLRTFPEPVLWSTRPHGSFGVQLELNRPGSGRYVENFGPRLEIPPATQASQTPATPEAPDTAETAAEAAPSPTLQHAKRDDFRWPN